MTRAFLGLGSNLGDSREHLRKALGTLRSEPHVTVTGVSDLYETEPMGGPSGQENYFNMVIEVDTELEPPALLDLCHRLESEAGRVRSERWDSRTLDVDILLFGDERIEEEDLVIPHPRMWERRFVIEPLGRLAPEVLASGPRGVEIAGEVKRLGSL